MSKDGEIGDAIVAAVRAIGLVVTGSTTLPADDVLRSKTPSLPPKANPPKVVVVVGETPSRVLKLTAHSKLSTWPCAVVIVTAGGRKFEDDERARTWRKQIEQRVFDRQRQSFAGVAGFNVCNPADKSPFDPEALDKDLNYLTSNFEVETDEDLAT